MELTGDYSQLLPGNVCSHNTTLRQVRSCDVSFNITLEFTMLWAPSQPFLIQTNETEFVQTPSFNPNLICIATACQYCTMIQSPGNGLTPKTAMLSAFRPEKELGRKKVHLDRMEKHDLIFL